MSYTIEQVKTAIKNHGYTQFAEDLRSQMNSFDNTGYGTYVNGLGRVTFVDGVRYYQEGNVWIVFKSENDETTTLYRINGFYDSYDGAEWEYAGVEEVEAQEVTTVVYNTVGR